MRPIKVSLDLDDIQALNTSAKVAHIFKYERDKARNELQTAKDQIMAINKRCNDLDAANMELTERLKAWKKSENAEKPIESAHEFIEKYDTPFESVETSEACEIIRQLLTMKEPPEAKPSKLSETFKQTVENAAIVLDKSQHVAIPNNGDMPIVNADIFNATRSALEDLHHMVLKEVIAG